MAETWNYLIVAEQELGRARASLTAALVDVGLPTASAAGPGTRELRLWKSTQGPTVIELVDWDEDDPKLAAALSRTLGADVAVSFHNGAGEIETYAFFVRGKRSEVPASPLGRLASEAAWDLTPASSEESLLVQGTATEACTRLEALIRKTLGELLDGLGFRRTKERVRYQASIDDVIGFRARLSDGSEILLRYDFPKGSLRECSQSLVLVSGKSETVLDVRKVGYEARWDEQPEYAERDMLRFRAHLLDSLSAVLRQRDSARAETLTTLGLAGSPVIEDPLVGAILQSDWSPAQLVFRGERMLNVKTANGWTFSFRCEGLSAVPQTNDIAVADVVELRSGGVRARAVRIGSSVLRFDALGKPVSRVD